MEACYIMHSQRDKIRQFKAVNNEFLRERNCVHEGSNASGDAPGLLMIIRSFNSKFSRLLKNRI
ncbi:unnamed protein product [Brassica rapa]|uniref:Uncharacterized protein n=1 Tax=Brassica campestris TaxID=3711 RepID=A0A3P6ABH7_BRACM|nr:unnamed protein product [Brassica rapa]VDC82520.1 unnamed protein product [Brassica rapa]